jgi:ketosteroid isomerase-like protein
MRRFLTVSILVALAGAVPAAQSATQVLDHHVAMMKQGNLDGVMSDYTDDALVVAPHGIAPGQVNVSGNDVFAGKENVRKLFAVLTDKDHMKGSLAMDTRYEPRGHDVILMHWVQFKGTPQEVKGTDTWIIKNGKVLAQVVTIDSSK